MAKRSEALKWTPETAQSEFGRDAATIQKQLKAANIQPDPSGTYSTKQICAAIFGDTHAARLRLVNAQALRNEVAAKKESGEVLPVDIAFQACSNVLFAVRRVIEMSGLTNAEKDEIYTEIQSFTPESIVSESKFEEGEREE
jgi:hypothetical protein